jgi:hypothetical protein
MRSVAASRRSSAGVHNSSRVGPRATWAGFGTTVGHKAVRVRMSRSRAGFFTSPGLVRPRLRASASASRGGRPPRGRPKEAPVGAEDLPRAFADAQQLERVLLCTSRDDRRPPRPAARARSEASARSPRPAGGAGLRSCSSCACATSARGAAERRPASTPVGARLGRRSAPRAPGIGVAADDAQAARPHHRSA